MKIFFIDTNWTDCRRTLSDDCASLIEDTSCSFDEGSLSIEVVDGRAISLIKPNSSSQYSTVTMP
jgi:hypothetical protein